jgi:hypothetical protein
MERLNLRKLKEAEGNEKFHDETSHRFAVLEDLGSEVVINSAWETIRDNIKISARDSLGYYRLKEYKPWFDEVMITITLWLLVLSELYQLT